MSSAIYLLCIASAALSQPPSTSASSAPADAPLYDLLPDNVVVALYVERPGTALPRKLLTPILKRVMPLPSHAERFTKVVARLPGPLLAAGLAVRAGHPEDQPVIIAARLAPNGPDIDKLLGDDIVPLLNDLSRGPGADKPTKDLVYQREPAPRRITRGDTTVFTIAVREGMLFGASDRQIVADWLAGEFPRKRWASDGRIRGLFGSVARSPRLRVLFNPAPLVASIPKYDRNSPEELAMQVLSPGDVRGVCADLSWDKASLSLDVRAALADQAGGIARALAQPPTASQSLGLFPADFIGVGRIAWPSAAALIGGAYAVMDRVDPDVSAEYRGELEDFQKETGVHFENDLAANLVGELAFGARVNFTKPNPIAWAVVCPLADAARFERQFDALLAHFQAPVQHKQSFGLNVRSSRLTVPFVFTVTDSRFIVADSNFTLGELAKQLGNAGAQPRDPALAETLTQLHSPNSACVLINLDTLGRSLGPMLNAVGPAAKVFSTGSAGLALTCQSGHAGLRVTWRVGKTARTRSEGPGEAAESADDESATSPIDALAMALEEAASSVESARAQARRAFVMSNMRGIGMGCHVYAQNHQGQFPADLAELVRDNMVTPQMFGYPDDENGPKSADDLAEKSIYIYRPGLSVKSDARELLLAERSGDGQGANFLAVDGHVEYIREPRASELIAEMRAQAATVRP